jgi:glutamate N-acetyltransferase/amino-acid N-acetyltransferase
MSSTGVIGRRYPIERMLKGIASMPASLPDQSVDRAAAAMMTTDTRPRIAEQTVEGSDARVVGVAKGAGMIEPNMATMIAIVLTDADLAGDALAATFSDVAERTFNCLSVDTDSSTSDLAVVLASGDAGAVEAEAFAAALYDVALSLTKQIAADGEGAETLIEIHVDGARDRAQAKRVAKSIVNSPLVKTAVHGADPNWGRVAMAIGKCDDAEDSDIDPDGVVIRFGDQEVYPARLDDDRLAELSAYLRLPEVLIHVTLGTGAERCTVWGCDLTAGYVRINADYTT